MQCNTKLCVNACVPMQVGEELQYETEQVKRQAAAAAAGAGASGAGGADRGADSAAGAGSGDADAGLSVLPLLIPCPNRRGAMGDGQDKVLTGTTNARVRCSAVVPPPTGGRDEGKRWGAVNLKLINAPLLSCSSPLFLFC